MRCWVSAMINRILHLLYSLSDEEAEYISHLLMSTMARLCETLYLVVGSVCCVFGVCKGWSVLLYVSVTPADRTLP